MIASFGLPSPYREVLVGVILLYIIVGPLFALGLLLGKSYGRLWVGWWIAFFSLVVSWITYLNTGTIRYFKGDTVHISYSDKWTDFVLVLAVAIFIFSCLGMRGIGIDGDSSRTHKILGVLCVFGIQFFVTAVLWNCNFRPPFW